MNVSENVSRRTMLSLLGVAFGFALVLTEDEAGAETVGTERHGRRVARHLRRSQPSAPSATPAASAGPTWHDNPNGTSGSEHEMQGQFRYY